ncbi:polymorphic toxin-type HINT domain-containing protein [Macrococcus capreoli]
MRQIVTNTNIQRLPSVLSQKVIPYRVVKDRVMHDISHVKKTIARPVEQFRKHYEPAFNQFIDNVSSGTKRAFNNLEYTKLVGDYLHVKLFNKPVFRLTREELGIILRSRMTDVKARLCEMNLIKNCFVAGTLVKTKQGLKPIEVIQTGDEVLSRCMETGYVSYKPVTEVFTHQTDVITKVTLSNGEVIESTPHHLYFTTNRGFIVAEELLHGDTLLTEQQLVEVNNVETKDINTDVYNIEVEDYHTYFIGQNSVLVHNDCTDAEMKIGYGKYLKNKIGPPDRNITRAHAHHIVYKRGIGEKQQEIVNRGQEILKKYGIDPILGLENLIWAPNIRGQHTYENILEVVNALEEVHNEQGSYDEIVKVLKEMGNNAVRRK